MPGLFESVGASGRAEKPAFERIIFEPVIVPALSPVAAHHDPAAGRIEAGWSVDGEQVTYDVPVPEGAEGKLVLSPAYRHATVDGVPLAGTEEDARSLLAPGKHSITFRISR